MIRLDLHEDQAIIIRDLLESIEGSARPRVESVINLLNFHTVGYNSYTKINLDEYQNVIRIQYIER